MAQEQLAGFTEDQLQLLADVARPDPAATHFSAVVTSVHREGTYRGRLHCPGCGLFLGMAESPAIGYGRKCQGCQRHIEIEVRGDSVCLVIRNETA